MGQHEDDGVSDIDLTSTHKSNIGIDIQVA